MPTGYERINPFDLETELDPESLVNYCPFLIILPPSIYLINDVQSSVCLAKISICTIDGF